jgi:hypothetical protein
MPTIRLRIAQLIMKLWKMALFAKVWLKKAATPASLGRTLGD